MADRSEEAEPGILFGEAVEEAAAPAAVESATEEASPGSEEQVALVLVEPEEAGSEAADAEEPVLDFTAATETDDGPSVDEAKAKKPVKYERFEKVNGERKELRTQIHGLTTERDQLTTRVASLEEEISARPATVPGWFNKLYGEWDQPEEVARIDHAIAEVLNENARVPIYRDVIEDIKAKLTEKEIKMGDKAPERVVEEQDEKPAPKKKGEAREAKPQSEGWAGKAVMRGTVRQVLDRGSVRPELRKTIEDAVLPKLMSLDDEPTEAVVIAEVQKVVKEQGWTRDFLVASKSAQRKAPPTGGVRGVATIQNASPEKKGSSDAKPDADGGEKPPESSDDWSHRQKRKMTTAFDSLTEAQRKGEGSPSIS